MNALTFGPQFAGEFARLVLAAGLSVMVLAAAIGWTKHATKTDEDTPDE